MVHMHRLLQNEVHTERLAMLIGITKLNEAASQIYPVQFNSQHNERLGEHMRRLVSQTSMDDLLQCFSGLSMTYEVNWGYDLQLESTRTFVVEQDLMELEAVRKKIKGLVPFHKTHQFQLGFPGLYAVLDFEIDVQAPIAVEVSAGVSTTVEFRYAEFFEVGFENGEVRVSTSGANPSVNIGDLSATSSISGYGGIRITKADASVGICYTKYCAHLHAHTETDLINFGFDVRLLNQAQLNSDFNVANPFYPAFASYDFSDCNLNDSNNNMLVLGTFFTVDKPRMTISYTLPQPPGTLGQCVSLPSRKIFEALWTDDPHLIQKSTTRCSSISELASLSIEDGFEKTDATAILPRLESALTLILSSEDIYTHSYILKNGALSENNVTHIKEVLKSALPGLANLSFENIQIPSNRDSGNLEVKFEMELSFTGLGAMKRVQSSLKNFPQPELDSVAAALIEKGFKESSVQSFEEKGLVGVNVRTGVDSGGESQTTSTTSSDDDVTKPGVSTTTIGTISITGVGSVTVHRAVSIILILVSLILV
jgi:hypothetical protein